jgi:predicted Zn-dependent protease
MKRFTVLATSLAIAAALAACTTAPSGRQQILLMSESQLSELGSQAFEQLKRDQPLSRDAGQQRYARCVVTALVAELPEPWRSRSWEVQVFADTTPNAFALPGGKVGVNAGMLQLAQNQDQLAAVIGHEIGHVVIQHANERVSRSQLVGAGVQLGGAVVGGATSPETARTVTGLLGAGAQVGLMLPFSRDQEREADVYGQDLMARAGFDPAQAAPLWQNMIAASGGARAPAFISTHPDPGARARALQQRAPALDPVYRQARQSGRTPRCG